MDVNKYIKDEIEPLFQLGNTSLAMTKLFASKMFLEVELELDDLQKKHQDLNETKALLPAYKALGQELYAQTKAIQYKLLNLAKDYITILVTKFLDHRDDLTKALSHCPKKIIFNESEELLKHKQPLEEALFNLKILDSKIIPHENLISLIQPILNIEANQKQKLQQSENILKEYFINNFSSLIIDTKTVRSILENNSFTFTEIDDYIKQTKTLNIKEISTINSISLVENPQLFIKHANFHQQTIRHQTNIIDSLADEVKQLRLQLKSIMGLTSTLNLKFIIGNEKFKLLQQLLNIIKPNNQLISADKFSQIYYAFQNSIDEININYNKTVDLVFITLENLISLNNCFFTFHDVTHIQIESEEIKSIRRQLPSLNKNQLHEKIELLLTEKSSELNNTITNTLQKTLPIFYQLSNIQHFTAAYHKLGASPLIARQKFLNIKYFEPNILELFSDELNNIQKSLISFKDHQQIEIIDNLNSYIWITDFTDCVLNKILPNKSYKKVFKQLIKLHKNPDELIKLSLTDKENIYSNLLLIKKCFDTFASSQKIKPNTAKIITFDEQLSQLKQQQYTTLIKELSLVLNLSQPSTLMIEHEFKELDNLTIETGAYCQLLIKDINLLQQKLNSDKKNINIFTQFNLALNELTNTHKNLLLNINNYLESKVSIKAQEFKYLLSSQDDFFKKIPPLTGNDEFHIFEKQLLILNKSNQLKSQSALNNEVKTTSNPITLWSNKLKKYDNYQSTINKFKELLISKGQLKTNFGNFFGWFNSSSDNYLDYYFATDFDEQLQELAQHRSKLIVNQNLIIKNKNQQLARKINLISTNMPTQFHTEIFHDLKNKFRSMPSFNNVITPHNTSAEINSKKNEYDSFYKQLETKLDRLIINIKTDTQKQFSLLETSINELDINNFEFYEMHNYHRALIINKPLELLKLLDYKLPETMDASININYAQESQQHLAHQSYINLLGKNLKSDANILINNLLTLLEENITRPNLNQDENDPRKKLLMKLHDQLLAEKFKYLKSHQENRINFLILKVKNIIETSLLTNSKLELLSSNTHSSILQNIIQWLRIYILKPVLIFINKNHSQPLYGASKLEKNLFFAIQDINKYELPQSSLSILNQVSSS